MPLVPSPTILPAANVDASFVGIDLGTGPIASGPRRFATTVVGSIDGGVGRAWFGSTAG